MTNAGSFIVSWSRVEGSEGVLIVGKKNDNGFEIVNAFVGEAAEKIYDLLVTKKVE